MDMTEIIKARELPRESETLRRLALIVRDTILEHDLEGRVMIDEQGTIREANFTVVGLLGVARSGLVWQPLFRFILPADRESMVVRFDDNVAEGQAH